MSTTSRRWAGLSPRRSLLRAGRAPASGACSATSPAGLAGPAPPCPCRPSGAPPPLLAALHADLETLTDLPGRDPAGGAGRRCSTPAPDGPSVEDIIKARVVPEDAAIMLEYAGRARERFAALGTARLPAMVTHGDLIGANVLYSRGALSGVIDFDFTHLDIRVADFVWTWRGTYDDFVRGYEDVKPLTATEGALLAPAYWVTVLNSVRMELLKSNGTAPVPLPGTIRYLRRRSELTGDGNGSAIGCPSCAEIVVLHRPHPEEHALSRGSCSSGCPPSGRLRAEAWPSRHVHVPSPSGGSAEVVR